MYLEVVLVILTFIIECALVYIMSIYGYSIIIKIIMIVIAISCVYLIYSANNSKNPFKKLH